MRLDFFARFHAWPETAEAVQAVLVQVIAISREEPDCLFIDAYEASNEPGVFLLHSRWSDEAAFDQHAGLAHTQVFLQTIAPLLQAPPVMNRARRLG